MATSRRGCERWERLAHFVRSRCEQRGVEHEQLRLGSRQCAALHQTRGGDPCVHQVESLRFLSFLVFAAAARSARRCHAWALRDTAMTAGIDR